MEKFLGKNVIAINRYEGGFDVYCGLFLELSGNALLLRYPDKAETYECLADNVFTSIKEAERFVIENGLDSSFFYEQVNNYFRQGDYEEFYTKRPDAHGLS